MAELFIEFTPSFAKDVKKLQRRRVDLGLLRGVVKLISANDSRSLEELWRRHRMHHLKGEWAGARECHVANIGDWLLVWRIHGAVAYLLRTGTHDDIFR